LEAIMDMPLHLHRWERRPFDWTAAAVAGFAGGAVLMALELLWSAFAPGSAGTWHLSQLVAALWATPHVFDLGTVATALVTHYVLGIGFGLVLGFAAAGLHGDENTAALVGLGAVFGLLLYGLNFHLMVHWFPWFAELQGWGTALAHVVFGVTAAVLYRRLARPPTRTHQPA
jgi:hypothetical protein